MKSIHAALTLLVGLAAGAWEADAHACGGCFNPPESPTVVTDHRMIFSISAQESTLYDQIQYTGAPGSFGWVLPYSGEIEVGVSSDVLFRTIDSLTQTQVFPPPRNCPGLPAGCAQSLGIPGAAGEKSASDDVNVLKREVVGPYDTAQLQASDPAALENWLTKNGFSLPDAVKPVVAAYVSEHFNFLALKLVPGQGVQAMKPVRVTTKGANVALPLRMVAAGTGATVGITLWIVAEGRYQPANFDMFQIKAEELTWDWTQNKSNYIDVRTQKNTAAQGRSWELESVTQVGSQTVSQIVNQGGPFGPGPYPGSAGYTADGQKTAEMVQDEDMVALFSHGPGIAKVTRIRADLDHAALDRDLTLQASTDQSLVDRQRRVTKELNEPQCPVYDNCAQSGTAPRSQAIAKMNDNNDGCATTTSHRGVSWIALGLGVIGFALSRRKKKEHS